VQLSVSEEKVPGGPLLVQQVSAHLFDPESAARVEGKVQVAITVGGVTTPIPWGQDPSGQPAYFVQFAQPPAAQSSYVITTSSPGEGTWHLQSNPATFDAVVTTPADGGVVEAGQEIRVAWPLQPHADFELVDLFARQGSSWTPSGATSPLRADVTETKLPIGDAGSYLVHVLFSNGNCPAQQDGCVFSESSSDIPITAR
jgi:hypothetical protein